MWVVVKLHWACLACSLLIVGSCLDAWGSRVQADAEAESQARHAYAPAEPRSLAALVCCKQNLALRALLVRHGRVRCSKPYLCAGAGQGL